MFSKNLEALRVTNPDLADRLEAMPISDKTTLFLGPNQEINIAYEDIALHRIMDPFGECRDLFETNVTEDAKSYQGLIFMFGLGLGYFLRRAFVHSEAQIVLFEPYLDVLRHTLEVVDLAKELASSRVRILYDKTHIIPIINNLYLLGDGMSIVPPAGLLGQGAGTVSGSSG